MKAFRWFPIVAVVAIIGLADRTASAQDTSQVGATAANTTAAPAAPATAAVPPAQGAQSCATCATCGANCGTAGNTGCDIPAWSAFGEFLLLRPRSEGIEYGVPINGPTAVNQVPVQIGATAVVDQQFQPGFRVGAERILDRCSSISVSYAYYRNETDNGPVTAPAPFVLQSMVFNPSTADAAAYFNRASASETTNFNLVDLDYHHNLWSCDSSSVNYLIGARYAQLGQQFHAEFDSTYTAVANANVEFDGIGLRVGLDGERSICNGFFVTARANANLLGGEFGAGYAQRNTNELTVCTTSWQDARFVTILESEVAIGWQSADGRIRASIGYLINDWFNVVKPSDYISSVQANKYNGSNQVGNTALVFDGMTAHVEFAW